jgi:hypothetical protein
LFRDRITAFRADAEKGDAAKQGTKVLQKIAGNPETEPGDFNVAAIL